MSAHDMTPDWVCSEAESRHRIALNATMCALDVMRCTLVVCVPIATCNVAHAAEAGEEAFEGGEMWQDVAALHVPPTVSFFTPSKWRVTCGSPGTHQEAIFHTHAT